MSANRFRAVAAVATFAAWVLASVVMPPAQAKETHLNLDPVGLQRNPPGTIRFSFSGYANPQRPFPGYVGEWQLGPVRISGSGELRGSDGAVVSGGQISHTDNLRDRRYPNHSTTWQVVKMLNVQSAGGRTALWLQVRVTSSNYPNICPVGTFGVVELVDDNRRLNNGYPSDAIVTRMPDPSSVAPSGGLACSHVHGFNNVDYNFTEPPRGGANGGIWAIVEISGSGGGCDISGTWRHTTEGIGVATWTFTPLGGGRYQAREQGLGNATGTAVLAGNTLRIDWVTGGLAGVYEWNLGSNCASGSGRLTFTRGRNSAHRSSIERMGGGGPGAPSPQSKDCAECARQKCAACRSAVIVLCRSNSAECEACMRQNGCR